MLGISGKIGSLAHGGVGRLLVTALLFGTAAATAVTATTGALFTDTASVPSNTFSTGTVDISTTPASALVSFTAMAPGDQVTNPITVDNLGSLQLRYAITSTTTEAVLAAELNLTIKTGVTTCTNAGFTADGAVIYGPADLGSTTGLNLVGDPAQGAQGGERTLNAATNEVLCFNVALPLSATNASQGLSSTATLGFIAEQTANN